MRSKKFTFKHYPDKNPATMFSRWEAFDKDGVLRYTIGTHYLKSGYSHYVRDAKTNKVVYPANYDRTYATFETCQEWIKSPDLLRVKEIEYELCRGSKNMLAKRNARRFFYDKDLVSLDEASRVYDLARELVDLLKKGNSSKETLCIYS
jgi:hypothetical protein